MTVDNSIVDMWITIHRNKSYSQGKTSVYIVIFNTYQHTLKSVINRLLITCFFVDKWLISKKRRVNIHLFRLLKKIAYQLFT